MLGIYRVAAHLVAYRVVLNSTELVNNSNNTFFPQISRKPPSQNGRNVQRLGITSLISINNDNRTDLNVGCTICLTNDDLYHY
jgi:hypothetical protein